MSEFVRKIKESREQNKFLLPSFTEAERLIQSIKALFFPYFSKHDSSTCATSQIESEIETIRLDLENNLKKISERFPLDYSGISASFCAELDNLRERLLIDALQIFNGDPAASSVEEVVATYPGFFAIMAYRIAHELHLSGAPILPRLITELAHQVTGIDIHPGAHIAEGFCIDHGTGIVIGETCVIEKNVKLYQGVTLGALSVEKSMADTKRHPTLEEGVVIYANATILGGATVIGKNSIVGGNVWVTSSIPANSKVYIKSEDTQIIKGI